jgi:ABC-2 type transport system permease protein
VGRLSGIALGPLKSLTHVLAFVNKEIVDVLRRPGAVISLILGPFLIMAIFGLGYSGIRKNLDSVLVIPKNAGISQDLRTYQDLAPPGFTVLAVTDKQASAEAALQAQQVDLVVVVPGDLEQQFRAGRRAVVQVEYNTIDPVQANYAAFLAERLSDEINRTILTQAVSEGENRVLQQAPDAQLIPPEVIAQPTEIRTLNIAPTQPTVVTFFGPAVMALILQHMAVTLTALSLVRERLSGVLELFRISPVNTLEILIGKYLAFGLLNAVIAIAVIGLMVKALGVPFLGSPLQLAGVVALLVAASLGLGLFISVISDSERQAVQLSLLLLLASVFFSGFVISTDQFQPFVRDAAYLLPVTHGIQLIQDLLLRGATTAIWQVYALASIAGALFLGTWVLLRRSLSHG